MPAADRVHASWAPASRSTGGLSMVAWAEGQRLVLSTEGGEVDFVVGVNLGVTVPGRWPGEVAIDRGDVRRWLPQMAGLGIHAVRVYTILPPAFYEELAAFNEANPDDSIYLVQGVVLDEERFLESRDLFDPELAAGFHEQISRAVDVVHGDAVVAEEPGHASGTYGADVSVWLAGFAIGIELDPVSLRDSDAANDGKAPYQGRYFHAAEDATPGEVFYAEALDVLAGALAERGTAAPLTFTNWPTTDPLEHPTEPILAEDLVSLDANNIVATDAWPAGQFASYHAYPYYPDFLRTDPDLNAFEFDGRTDPYAGYLARLRDHHRDLPVAILEVGLPSSLGSAHEGPLGRDQGGHDETTAMRLNAEVVEVIHGSGHAGAFLFAWKDEWFKATWNTAAAELPPGRRAMWKNALSAEQNYGLLTVDPGAQPDTVLDGSPAGWDANGSVLVASGGQIVRSLRATMDAAYLWVLIELEHPTTVEEWPLAVGFGIHPEEGAPPPDAHPDTPPADVAVVIDPNGTARGYVQATSDLSLLAGDDVTRPPDLAADEDGWRPWALLTGHEMINARTGEQIDADWQDLSQLTHGIADPSHPEFDSNALWARNDRHIEMRIPHSLLGLADPSSRQALHVTAQGPTTIPMERLDISISTTHDIDLEGTFSFEGWNRVEWHERPKAGLSYLTEKIAELGHTTPER